MGQFYAEASGFFVVVDGRVGKGPWSRPGGVPPATLHGRVSAVHHSAQVGRVPGGGASVGGDPSPAQICYSQPPDGTGKRGRLGGLRVRAVCVEHEPGCRRLQVADLVHDHPARDPRASQWQRHGGGKLHRHVLQRLRRQSGSTRNRGLPGDVRGPGDRTSWDLHTHAARGWLRRFGEHDLLGVGPSRERDAGRRFVVLDTAVIQGYPAVFENPLGGFGTCTTWDTLQTCVGLNSDFAFELDGTTAPPPCYSQFGALAKPVNSQGGPGIPNARRTEAADDFTLAQPCSATSVDVLGTYVGSGVATSFRVRFYLDSGRGAAANTMEDADCQRVHGQRPDFPSAVVWSR